LDRQAALIDGRWKYVHHGVPAHDPLDPTFATLTLRGVLTPGPREELFDLERDPSETENLAPREPGIANHRREQLFAELRRLRALGYDGDRTAITPELEEQLRNLGYIE
jgi:arylsulfatase A-like enzyme